MHVLLKRVGISFALVLFANAIGCAHTPPNVEACIRLFRGAACTWTIEGEDRNPTEREWGDMQLARISMTPAHWIEIRKFIEKVCAREKACDKGWEMKIDRFNFRTMTVLRALDRMRYDSR